MMNAGNNIGSNGDVYDDLQGTRGNMVVDGDRP